MKEESKYHDYIKEDCWRKVRKGNKEILDAYLDFCKSENKSPGTIFIYKNNVRIFLIWIQNYANNKKVENITNRNLNQFYHWMKDVISLSEIRIINLLRSINTFLLFIKEQLAKEHIDFNVKLLESSREKYKSEIKKKEALTEQQINSLLKKLIEKGKYQYALLVVCMTLSKNTKEEIIQFKVDFFAEDKIKDGFYVIPEIKVSRYKPTIDKNRYLKQDIVQPYFDLWIKQRWRVTNENLFIVKNTKGKWVSATRIQIDNWMRYAISKIVGQKCCPSSFIKCSPDIKIKDWTYLVKTKK